MGHDQLFKTLLEKFLKDFLQLFFPDVAARLDFGTVQFLDKELTTDFPRGTTREVDVVAKLETQEGEPEIVLVHVEVQSRPEKDFGRRMFEYSVLLWLREQAPVFPIVLYLRGGQGLEDEDYRVELFGRELFRFRYATVGLAHLEAEEYLKTGPLGAGLAALMASARDVDPVLLEMAMMRRVAESGLDEARQFLLIDLIQTYSKLSVEERVRFEHLVSRKENRTVKEVKTTWSERLREEGREAGLLEGKREALLRQLTTKFGAPSEATRSQIQALESAEELDTYLARILTADSIEDMDFGS